ncbi:urease accessory protein UreE [Roseivivax marinus]|jgi:urease accessory protein|uniref:Urease accessory protein UreE n=1 Tax=Roseivivax marinus TaxID=1379903 RepID=W4HNI1_9RHOB|nr:urease accessory protein UreE [Roseivivax marinus]ETW13676.1 urease accessory protein UreE [Roseivivax marinus]UMA65248.1 urease accessory protein UreE [Roseivivax marinus]SEK52007.1 urease accessory protein [Roseivivax marinus]
MSAPALTARRVADHGHDAGAPTVSLDYEARFLRRKVLPLDDGRSVLVDLSQTTSLNHGDVLICEDGTEVRVAAAAEPLLAVTGDLVRLAWHIGNRHTPCQVEAERLLIRRDHVMRDMLGRLGATVEEVTAPFRPEGGAYGHGRTHGHDHSHAHGPEGHNHAHPHSHSHD